MRFLELLNDVWRFLTFRYEPRFDSRNPAASILQLTKNLSYDQKRIVANAITSLMFYENMSKYSRGEKVKHHWEALDNLTLPEILQKARLMLEKNRESKRKSEP